MRRRHAVVRALRAGGYTDSTNAENQVTDLVLDLIYYCDTLGLDWLTVRREAERERDRERRAEAEDQAYALAALMGGA
jgi:hypothetical protein